MKFEVEIVQNGIILKVPSESADFKYDTFVFDYGHDMCSDKEESEAIRNMFYALLEQIKPNSKHNKYVININVEEQNNG